LEVNDLYISYLCFKKFPPFLGYQIPVAMKPVSFSKGFFPQFSDGGGFFTCYKIDMAASK